MRYFKTAAKITASSLLLACVLFASATASETRNASLATLIDRDGWHTWRVAAIPDAPDWCCATWRNGEVLHKACELDGRHGGFSSFDDSAGQRPAAPQYMQVYARLESGQVTRVRAYSEHCEVRSQSAVADHGDVGTGDSVAWLMRQSALPDTLAVVAVHAGAAATSALRGAADPGQPQERRKQAVFWTGQVRSADLADWLMSVMRNDADAAVREHAAFSVSQSPLTERGPALRELARHDASAQVRSKAWFWLVQSGTPDAGKQVLTSLVAEPDREVREQMVFALSQLDETPAARALIAVIADARHDERLRKHALFWLAQNESTAAAQYLEQVLSGR